MFGDIGDIRVLRTAGEDFIADNQNGGGGGRGGRHDAADPRIFGLRGKYDGKIAVLAGFCLFFGAIAAILLGRKDENREY